MFKKVTPATLPEVFEKLLRLFAENKADGEEFCSDFDKFLEDLHDDDFFGTEGQLDPRGDRRD